MTQGAPSTLGVKTQPEFQIGYVVKDHLQVHSKVEREVVQELSYKVRGEFQITASLGKNYYEVKRYNQPDSTSRTYKGTNMYLLPPRIFPRDPLDTTDQQYLNYDYAPVTSPLKNQ